MSARVLIVEDEFLIGLELEHALEAHGYKVIGVVADYDGAVALAAERPDVALVDINLRDGPTGPLIARELAAFMLEEHLADDPQVRPVEESACCPKCQKPGQRVTKENEKLPER
ncbi:MAG: hypothetical protein ACK40O_12230, partial [Allosphingosinicella sp.]